MASAIKLTHRINYVKLLANNNIWTGKNMTEKKKKRMPWEAPELALPTHKEIQEEDKKSKAFRDTIEGGCWFSHVGGIHTMEESYAKRNRNLSKDKKSSPKPN